MPEKSVLWIGCAGAKHGFSDGEMQLVMMPIPHEFAIGEVYLPPLLVAAVFGFFTALLTARLLNRYRLSRYFFYPPVVVLALMVIYTVLIGTFVIRG